MENTLFYGDNLNVLREKLTDNSIDLIYLDPPFNSKRSYNVLFTTPKGFQSEAQITAFEDSWTWGDQAEREYAELLHQPNTNVSEVVQSLRRFLKNSDVMAYLVMMANRLLELERVLKPAGSLYLHCDPTSSHYLKIIMDAVFGGDKFRNEISWRRSGRRSSIYKIYRRAHDIIFFYSKSDKYTFNMIYKDFDDTLLDKYTGHDERGIYRLVPLMGSGKVQNGETGRVWRGYDPGIRGKSGMHWLTIHEKLEEYVNQGLVVFPKKPDGAPQLKYYLDQNKGVPVSDFWDDIDLINSMGNESIGYQTQKPLALLERIILASSNPGDLVLDPFCGCGTAIHAAQLNNRNWIGIDITHLAIGLIERRLHEAFPNLSFMVHGTPKDFDGARDLAIRDKYEFQYWACSLIDAQPYQGKKKGADTGIDGLIFFQDEKNSAKKIIVSVKGGEHVTRTVISDLKNSVDREKAQIGILVSLVNPTEPMEKEAVSAGFYDSPIGKSFPKIQILTIPELLSGSKTPQYPDLARGGLSFRKTKTEIDRGNQPDLF
jgi:DNA modification methylase